MFNTILRSYLSSKLLGQNNIFHFIFFSIDLGLFLFGYFGINCAPLVPALSQRLAITSCWRSEK
jgi:hypothetical protein